MSPSACQILAPHRLADALGAPYADALVCEHRSRMNQAVPRVTWPDAYIAYRAPGAQRVVPSLQGQTATPDAGYL